ncbi:MAG TPA: septal ring lytic transglycosylase RlpA family protein [Candidatus Syntrophosphaera sp.]|mgnify:CR=1 FL=1|jgi:rare lipoprotein A|nr:septal ring lytic transglycosylase RlpA family protein [Candidatus Cloacimonadota bacterium]OQB90590.1 MAG: RlpA-like protein precursor [Candidatus Cloacimonetes bacterium ADurb.Bin117]HNU54617.1 septal ring lytic transglycosylase RlpA family protein [Candidatus Syntrophosphaera sp.]MDI9524467.1 septal ring lytic transglycosylase RlpA family protein [Candidatus Cloacimonadota bacterium]HOH49011.1 septal ring lytic transglycosylase RlpA family protein [Candidatus Syntrophosphaera sp.]
MRNQSKKTLSTVFAIWVMFIAPILAQTVVGQPSTEELTIPYEQVAVIDSLQNQEPPSVEEAPPGETWVASYYGKRFHGRRTASGEVYNQNAMTCAHKTLPFQTLLKITNPKNGKNVIVRVTDRGPFKHGRDIDLSYGAAKEIGMLAAGVMKVEVVQLQDRKEYTEL